MAGTDRVAEVMRRVDRRHFLPRDQRRWAADDRPLTIGHGQTNSQPSTVAAMLRLLDVPPGSRVLDVGAGSGWTTALLARLVGPTGQVVALERHADLAARAAASVRASGRTPWATVGTAEPGALGVPGQVFDRVLVSASASALPTSLVDQVAPGGRMVVPVRHTMVLVVRDPDGSVRTTEHGSYTFVPLVEDPPQG
ncbi:protein-L-isoaspartate O-methyltransferase family protein [Cellulosimicrobium arenosum]|uniref:Protein-L-isoaspartate O-methyltransferase n=1 Tax=Cellulosimicrobium arenosum TaxID=2708133 RepID=A0A927J2I5_9MICO|nr:methyltransferase domain-containing protein [Cellulosimicrobium arenosum]MBD8080677.1 methyltransferase domain-containing protein [Cellulosimicrobium arenosum]